MKISRFIVDSKQPDSFKRLILSRWPEAHTMNLGEDSGDLFIELESGKQVAVETKEVPDDFLASIMDRRIFAQATGIRQITPWAFCLLGSDFRYDSSGRIMVVRERGYVPSNWTREHIDGVLTRIQASGVIIRFAHNGYADAIARILEWVDSADNGSITRPEPVKLSPFDESSQEAANWLTNFPGVGVIQAKHFLDWAGDRPIWEYLTLCTRYFRGTDKPRGWTNHTIDVCRQSLGLVPGQSLALYKAQEWKEGLDNE